MGRTPLNARRLGALLAVMFGLIGLTLYVRDTPRRERAAARRDLAAGNLHRAEAVALRRADVSAPAAEDLLLLAEVHRRLNRPADAEAALERAVAAGLPEEAGRREFALILAAGEWPERADGILRAAARDPAADAELLLALATGQVRRGRWPDAESAAARLAEVAPTAEALFLLGRARAEQGQHERAVADFRRAAAVQPRNFTARLWATNSLLADARYAEAEPLLRECNEIRPDRPEPHVGLAIVAMEGNNFAAAEEHLRRATALAPDTPLVLHELANLYLRRGQPEFAEPALRRLLLKAPDDKKAHLQLAQTLRRLGGAGRNDEAAKLEAKYRELDKAEAIRDREPARPRPAAPPAKP